MQWNVTFQKVVLHATFSHTALLQATNLCRVWWPLLIDQYDASIIYIILLFFTIYFPLNNSLFTIYFIHPSLPPLSLSPPLYLFPSLRPSLPLTLPASLSPSGTTRSTSTMRTHPRPQRRCSQREHAIVYIVQISTFSTCTAVVLLYVTIIHVCMLPQATWIGC